MVQISHVDVLSAGTRKRLAAVGSNRIAWRKSVDARATKTRSELSALHLFRSALRTAASELNEIVPRTCHQPAVAWITAVTSDARIAWKAAFECASPRSCTPRLIAG